MDLLKQYSTVGGDTGCDASAAEKNDDHCRNEPISSASSPPYLKLIADCWEHIFDYLSLKDIIITGQTCKRMHQMAGYYVRRFLPDHQFYLIDNKIHTNGYSSSLQLEPDFYQYIRKLRINKSLNGFMNIDKLSSVNTLIISCVQLDAMQIHYIRNLLQHCVNIQLNWCKIFDMGTYEQLIVDCPKLKHLTVYETDLSALFTPNVKTSIFTQYFPSLEQLHYQSELGALPRGIEELKSFFEKHTKLKYFRADHYFLWMNREMLMRTENIQLHVLTIYLYSMLIPIDGFVDFLKTLHARGFYKKLHLIFDYCSVVDVKHLNNMPGLEMLSKYSRTINIDLAGLTNLKQLQILDPNLSVENIEAIAKKLPKLERLVIDGATTIDIIRPFICHSKRLKSIKMFSPVVKKNLCYNLDLVALNVERKKIAYARPIALYFDEDVYLRAKWISRHANLSHIEIRRFED